MPTSKDILLNVSQLSAGYGQRQVLFDVSFSVNSGEMVLLIGGNGSGKSTLLKAIYGLVNKQQAAAIHFNGDNITDTKPYQLIQKGIVYVPQKNNVFDQLSVSENLEVAVTHLHDNKQMQQRITAVFAQLPQLTPLKNRTPFHLSGGEKQLLALGMALMQQPKLILLDEPGAGLAPHTWQQNLETINTLNQQGITFLIVEHRVKETIDKMHHVLQMRLGKIINVETT